jgi:hypothetical protein
MNGPVSPINSEGTTEEIDRLCDITQRQNASEDDGFQWPKGAGPE